MAVPGGSHAVIGLHLAPDDRFGLLRGGRGAPKRGSSPGESADAVRAGAGVRGGRRRHAGGVHHADGRAGAGRGQHVRQNADRKRRFGARDDDAQIKGAGVPRGVPDEHGAQASVDADQ